MILFIDACVNENSRTRRLAFESLGKVSEPMDILKLENAPVGPLDRAKLEARDRFVKAGDFRDPMFDLAKQFAAADEIVIAAPYWDLSIPAILKCYLECICVPGLLFVYTEGGVPKGLCRARRMTFVVTAGGFIPESNHAYDYVRDLCAGLFGIPECRCVKAEGLDIDGADVESILQKAIKDAGRQG